MTNKRVEGYWYSEFNPEYPQVVPNSIDQSIKKPFINALLKVQQKSREVWYRGTSNCRICSQDNGSMEYEYKGWAWPNGFMHYVMDHDAAPSKDFFEFIMKEGSQK